jgi:LysM repeat protein
VARRPASRWLAPIAIVAVGVAAFAVLSSGGDGDGAVTRSATTAAERPATERATATSPASGPRTYVVRSGDTLSSISLETRVSVARLQTLNPDVDIQALQPGQRLRLRS